MKLEVCKKCVLCVSPPDIWLDAQGVCNICRNFEAEQQCHRAEDRSFLETDFIKILEKHRGKHKYDCLCMLSGGKDSTASLYYVKERYKMNPLVFTFNHGFVPDEHLDSARKTVDKLNVDWIYFETSFMKEIFRKIIKSQSRAVICPICSLWYMLKTYEVAARWDIPIIISGWTKGQTTGTTRSVMSKCACDQNPDEYKMMTAATREFMETHVRSDPKYKDFPINMSEVLKIARTKYKSKAIVLSPHWFVPSTPQEYVRVIKEKLGWDFPQRSYPRKSTNCDLNFPSSALAIKNYGYSHYHIEMSNMIRLGMVTREEALKMLDMEFNEDLLDPILKKLDCNYKDIQSS
jgi:hypothetical protein